MGLVIKMSDGKERELHPEGDHDALLYQLVELGTQPNNYGPDKRRLSIGWELPGLAPFETDEGVKKPKCFWQGYNLPEEGRGLHPKSNLRKMLTKWRSREFSTEEMEGFELKTILGKACIIRIEHEVNDNTGKLYQKLMSVRKWPKDKEVPELQNELQFFSFQDDMDVPGNLPEWMRKAIMESYEYQHRGEELGAAPYPSEMPADDSDIPF